MPEPQELIEQARHAASRGEWQEAYGLLVRADARGLLSRADLALFAQAAYAAGHLEVTFDIWERAYAQSVRDGDRLAGAEAAVRVAVHLLMDTALMAPIRAWLIRAESLVKGHDESAVHAWLAVLRNYERLLSGDFAGARAWAAKAIEIGSRHAPAAAAVGKIARARSLILEGSVGQGLALLDEAAAAAFSGELDAQASGMIYCELLCGLQGVAQYDLAEEWTTAMETWRRTSAFGSFHGRCRVHRAEILRLRGSLDEAEAEALLACDELRPYLRRELGWPLSELGQIRLRTGDVAGAEEAFIAAHEVGWDPHPGLALVRLAQGDVPGAVAAIRDALDQPLNVPSKERPPNTELRRAPLLEAQAEIEIAAGDLERARAAADELERVAAQFESKAFAASAAHARGRVRLAEADAFGACRVLDTAVQLWNEVGAPYEAALARMSLAEAHRAMGKQDRAGLELRAAQSTFERIGALHLAERAANLHGESGGAARQAVIHTVAPVAPSACVFRREGDSWYIAFDGASFLLRDLKGVRYLVRLLSEPGQEFHALELVALESGGSAQARSALGDAGEMLDDCAKEMYRRRLDEIADDIEAAKATGDTERAAQAEREREFLARELSRAVGLGGRDRIAGSVSERARASTTRALRQAIARVREHHPALADHLDCTVRTGTYCVYQPDPRAAVSWQT